MKAGFRIDATQARRKFAKVRRAISANAFRVELMEFVRKSLNTAAQTTPVREASLIRANQSKQYDHRINYIPSYHTLENPSLIVNDMGEHWIYSGGKWYNGAWHLPDEVFSEYQDLLSERERRMQTNRQAFINSRSAARFLYRDSWSEVAESLGLPAMTRKGRSRRNPPKAPPRGYGQIRGGKDVLSVDIRNPFLEQPSQYKSFSGRVILQAAMNKHRNEFEKATGRAFRNTIKANFA